MIFFRLGGIHIAVELIRSLIHHDCLCASMERERIVSPENSMVDPVPPAVPITPQRWSTMSLEVTPTPRVPSTRTSMLLAFFCRMVEVARTCST